MIEVTVENSPMLCQQGHDFFPRDQIVTPTGGVFKGAEVMAEVMVIITRPEDYHPQVGGVCNRCFQVYGKDDGVRDQQLLEIWRTLSKLENPPPPVVRVSRPYVSPLDGLV